MTERPLCAITGPTHGIGTVVAAQLSARGYRLVLLCRNLALGRDLQRSLPAPSEVIHCDLGDLTTVASAAAQLQQRHEQLHVLINNAGILELHKRRIAGEDAMMMINHIGHFLLSTELLPLLHATTGSRIVVTSSAVHRLARLSIKDPLGTLNPGSGLPSYARSKLANLCFALALAQRLRGGPTVCNALHPGIVLSHLMQSTGGWVGRLSPLLAPFALSASEGARTTVFLASAAAAGAMSGRYLDQRQKQRTAAPQALAPPMQAALWQASERVVAPYRAAATGRTSQPL